VSVPAPDLASGGFGTPWGHDLSWTNKPGYASNQFQGDGWTAGETPRLFSNGSLVMVVGSAASPRYFDQQPGGSYTESFYLGDTLSYDSTNDQYLLTDEQGGRMTFWGFGSSTPTNKHGQLQNYTDPAGNVVAVTSQTSDNKIAEVQRSGSQGGSTVTESYLYSYVSSGANAGLVSGVTLRRKVDSGSWTTVRQVAYTYYDGVESYGNATDLKTAQVKDAAGNVLDIYYYRYWNGGRDRRLCPRPEVRRQPRVLRPASGGGERTAECDGQPGGRLLR
jgi:hypothetical protein